MSVNLNPGLFAQNFQVKNNAVKQAPAASLSTPLATDRVDFSFKKAQNKVGFKSFMGKATKKIAKDHGAEAVKTVKELADAMDKGAKDLVDELEDDFLILMGNAISKRQLKPTHIAEMREHMNNNKLLFRNRIVRGVLKDAQKDAIA